MKWVANLNDSTNYLVFIVNGDKLWAMHNDPISKVQIVVIRDSFQNLIINEVTMNSSKILTLNFYLFILTCFEFGVFFFFQTQIPLGALFSFNLCCSFFFLNLFLGLWV
jgi:hypothetical protein